MRLHLDRVWHSPLWVRMLFRLVHSNWQKELECGVRLDHLTGMFRSRHFLILAGTVCSSVLAGELHRRFLQRFPATTRADLFPNRPGSKQPRQPALTSRALDSWCCNSEPQNSALAGGPGSAIFRSWDVNGYMPSAPSPR